MIGLASSRSMAFLLFVLASEAPGAAQLTGPKGNGATFGVPVVDITFEPSDAPHATCKAFGPCPPENFVTTEYLGFGVDFSAWAGHAPVAVFDDPPEKFGGVNDSGILDLFTTTCGRIVVPGSSAAGLTDFIAVAAGLADPGGNFLEAFDSGGVLIGSSFNDDGMDADGDLIAEVSDPTNSIAGFCVSTPNKDAFGVHFVYLNDPTQVPVVLQAFAVE